jgi:hypothetical protein
MQAETRQALVTQERDLRTYAELWHASECVLEVGGAQHSGSSWQFLSSIVLTAFAFEAYLNHVGEREPLSCWRRRDKLPVRSKLGLLCKALKVGLPWAEDERPLLTVTELVKFRNTLAHGRTKAIAPEPTTINLDELEARRSQPLLSSWEELIQTADFAQRARMDVEAVIKLIHAARPEPKEGLFSFGGRSWYAVVQQS